MKRIGTKTLVLHLCLGRAGETIEESRAQGNACGCPDLQDMRNRISIAHAAIDLLERELRSLAAMTPAPTADGRAPGASLNNEDLLKASIKRSQGDVQDPDARTGVGETFVDCTSTVTAPTACLDALLSAHEAVHHQACEDMKKRRALGRLTDRWVGTPRAACISEDIRG